MTIGVLAKHGEANTVIASQLGVTESTVPYHRNRIAEGLKDGRKNQTLKAAAHVKAVAAFVERCRAEEKHVNVADLRPHLVALLPATTFCSFLSSARHPPGPLRPAVAG